MVQLAAKEFDAGPQDWRKQHRNGRAEMLPRLLNQHREERDRERGDSPNWNRRAALNAEKEPQVRCVERQAAEQAGVESAARGAEPREHEDAWKREKNRGSAEARRERDPITEAGDEYQDRNMRPSQRRYGNLVPN